MSDDMPELTVVTESTAPTKVTMTKRALVEEVATRSGKRPSDVRDIVEATLETIGTALNSGEALQVPPLGKLKIQKRKSVSGAEVFVLKLRRNQPAEG